MTLNPQENFTVFRIIDDHTDPSRDSYYVRAVIRNARTSALIKTLDLENLGAGTGEYAKEWQVPADPSGLGFYIKIVTSVYTDSGYTTKSANYSDEGMVYLVQERMNAITGGSDVNYKRIREIIGEEIKKIIIPEVKIPDPQQVDLSSVLLGLNKVLTAVEGISMPKPDKVDLGPIVSQIEAVKQAVGTIKMPKQKEVDLSAVLKGFENVLAKLKDFEALNPGITDTKKEIGDLKKNIDSELLKIQKSFLDIKDLIDSLEIKRKSKPIKGLKWQPLQ